MNNYRLMIFYRKKNYHIGTDTIIWHCIFMLIHLITYDILDKKLRQLGYNIILTYMGFFFILSSYWPLKMVLTLISGHTKINFFPYLNLRNTLRCFRKGSWTCLLMPNMEWSFKRIRFLKCPHKSGENSR